MNGIENLTQSEQIVFRLMVVGPITPREYADEKKIKREQISADFSNLIRIGVVERTRLGKRSNGFPVILTPAAMESVMKRLRKGKKRIEAIPEMIDEFEKAASGE